MSQNFLPGPQHEHQIPSASYTCELASEKLRIKGNAIAFFDEKLDGMPDEIIKNKAKKADQLSNAEVQPIVTILDTPPERAAKRTQIALSEVDDVPLFGLKEKHKQNLKLLKKY